MKCPICKKEMAIYFAKMIKGKIVVYEINLQTKEKKLCLGMGKEKTDE